MPQQGDGDHPRDHDGDEVFVAVLGASSKLDRFNDAKALAVWAFNTFTWPKI